MAFLAEGKNYSYVVFFAHNNPEDICLLNFTGTITARNTSLVEAVMGGVTSTATTSRPLDNLPSPDERGGHNRKRRQENPTNLLSQE